MELMYLISPTIVSFFFISDVMSTEWRSLLEATKDSRQSLMFRTLSWYPLPRGAYADDKTITDPCEGKHCHATRVLIEHQCRQEIVIRRTSNKCVDRADVEVIT